MQQHIHKLAAAISMAGLLLWASCAPAVDTDALAKELTRLDDDWSKAAVARDVEKVASYYAEDAIAYPPNEPMAVGRTAAKKVWAAVSLTDQIKSDSLKY